MFVTLKERMGLGRAEKRSWQRAPQPRSFLPRLEQLESRLAPAVILLNHFDGLNSGSPPDTCGAAGPNSYVETVNSSVAIYNKSTGAVIASDSLSDFLFTKGGIRPLGGLFDATMAYDEVTGQFIVGDLDLGSNSASALNIAVSKNSNPTTLDGSSWNFYQIITSEANEFADYPGNFGYNADAFVFTYNMFACCGGGSYHTEVVAVSQSSLAAGGTMTVHRFDVNNWTMRPVTMHDSTAGGPMWFVTEGGNNQSIDLMRIDNILTTHTLSTFNIGVNSYNSINAPLNPDGTTITSKIDTRIMKAAERNNTIVACQHVGVGSNEDDARWYEFNVSNINSPYLVQQGNVGFGANTYTVYPAIDIDSAGDIAMGFTKSGHDTSTDYMSTYITGRNSLDAAGTMETPVEVKAGNSNNYNGREGDFSGINVDPIDGTFWAADEYTTNNGGTEVAHFFILPTVPNLAGMTLFNMFGGPTSLAIQSVSDQGGGHGTFVGVYQDTFDGVSMHVSGSITLKGVDPNYAHGLTFYDFALTFFGYKAGTISYSEAGGSVDFKTSVISGNANDYQYPTGRALWDYRGTDWDMVVSTRFNWMLEENFSFWNTNI